MERFIREHLDNFKASPYKLLINFKGKNSNFMLKKSSRCHINYNSKSYQ